MSDPRFSVTLPVYCQAGHIAGVVNGYVQLLDEKGLDYELILVVNVREVYLEQGIGSSSARERDLSGHRQSDDRQTEEVLMLTEEAQAPGSRGLNTAWGQGGHSVHDATRCPAAPRLRATVPWSQSLSQHPEY